METPHKDDAPAAVSEPKKRNRNRGSTGSIEPTPAKASRVGAARQRLSPRRASEAARFVGGALKVQL